MYSEYTSSVVYVLYIRSTVSKYSEYGVCIRSTRSTIPICTPQIKIDVLFVITPAHVEYMNNSSEQKFI